MQRSARRLPKPDVQHFQKVGGRPIDLRLVPRAFAEAEARRKLLADAPVDVEDVGKIVTQRIHGWPSVIGLVEHHEDVFRLADVDWWFGTDIGFDPKSER